jgi:hypothetical protein
VLDSPQRQNQAAARQVPRRLPRERGNDKPLRGRILALDQHGNLLGSFPDLRTGHLWAHFRVREPGFSAHVELLDAKLRVSVLVSPKTCALIRWVMGPPLMLPCDHASGEADILSRREVLWPRLRWEPPFRLPPPPV